MRILLLIILSCFFAKFTYAQNKAGEHKEIQITRTSAKIKIDGQLDEAEWKRAAIANHFTALRPTPFKKEEASNATTVYFLYNDEGVFIGGYCKESKRDSISYELIGRDGFGNNDFIGITFDTYSDKLNGFEYFVTPLGEQMDAKFSPNINGNNEDFSWNAVWKSAAKIQSDGWSFEMFIPYSAIRFGKKKIQDWGMNIVRKRQKCGEQLFWNTIDPSVNGFLTQEGYIRNFVDLKPPLRLQFSPYLSNYINHDGTAEEGLKKNTTTINGGMDVKYGINQAFTLDMTLIPDFGQVQSDSRILNLSPFEVRYAENRSFFTEGTEFFNKGNLFYSRQIGSTPIHYSDVYNNVNPHEFVAENPTTTRLINATKISGRMQNGLGIAVLNAITKPEYALIEDSIAPHQQRKVVTNPLTNYNVFVLDKTLKNNSSISFVNTNTLRNGKDYDADVNAFLFDLNDKKNMWNLGGNIGTSEKFYPAQPVLVGYTHTIYFGKTSGRFNFNVAQTYTNDQYYKDDLGYFTNNNSVDNSCWLGYHWNKPHGWYNYFNFNFSSWYSYLVTPLDKLLGNKRMFENAGANINTNAQTKKLWNVGFNLNFNSNYNDFYEPRSEGRVFANKGSIGMGIWWNSNDSKKYSWGGNLNIGEGGVFKRKSIDGGLFGKIRFNSKFSIDGSSSISIANNNPGWADGFNDTIMFSRRNLRSVENFLNAKYNFNTKMGLTIRTRHYWSKVDPKEFYMLNAQGNLVSPNFYYSSNKNQNYNYLTVDMVYTWQFGPGSFFNIVWKDIGEYFTDNFERNYFDNFKNSVSGKQFNSLSLKVVYFLDYLKIKRKRHDENG